MNVASEDCECCFGSSVHFDVEAVGVFLLIIVPPQQKLF